MEKPSLHLSSLIFIILIAFIPHLPFTTAYMPTSPRPDPGNNQTFARWMIRQGSWGVLTTIDSQNEPFGNVMSYSDGATGVPYFFLTTKYDPTGAQALKNPESSLTLSERQLGSCDESKDAQSPDCAKITLTGKLKLIDKDSEEGKFARLVLFKEHPSLGGWPTGEGLGFEFFKLEIEKIFLVNDFAPYKIVGVNEYFQANVSAGGGV